MKRGIIPIVVSCILLVSLPVFANGSKDTAAGAPAAAGPHYGGTLTAWIQDADKEPPSPDAKGAQFSRVMWLQNIQEKLVVGDFEKYGPRGTNEFDFTNLEYVPAQYMKGQLLESWEFQPDKTIWHLRKGIYWAPTEDQIARGVMKAPRELTAEDIVDSFLYYRSTSEGGDFSKFAGGEITAADKYTVVVKWTNYAPISMLYTGMVAGRTLIRPPETRKAGGDKWENQIGTGPFMLKEYVPGSHMSFKANPNYWDTTTIDGKKYKVPFVAEMKCPIIADEATRISALRTGALDYVRIVPATHWGSLDQTTPQLKSKRFINIYNNIVHLRSNQPPFNNVNVRRAVMIGTNHQEFQRLENTGGLTIPTNFWPAFVGNPDVYVPPEKLPEACRALLDYNPTLAKQMLADAGYPNGFKMSLDALGSDPVALDRAALLKDQWAKIGVEVNIKANDSTTQWGHFFNKTYSDGLLLIYGTGNPMTALNFQTTTGYLNAARWSDQKYDELMASAGKELNDKERSRLLREAGQILLEKVPILPLSCGANAHFWWPWVQNLYGEYNVGNAEIAETLARAWIDQNLKKSMGH